MGSISKCEKMKTFRSIFPCPITAMTTTIKPAHLLDLKTSVLRTPVFIKGSIDRSNVKIHILPYCVGKIKNEDTETDEKWEPVAV